MLQPAQRDSSSIDWELMFCSKVLNLPSLHWGCWRDGDPLTLSNFREAQIRFRELVTGMVPLDESRVLDVGCGRGDMAARLSTRGHAVVGIAPIKNYRNEWAELSGPSLDLRIADFRAFEDEAGFDVVLFSESAGYFKLDEMFDAIERTLKPGGMVVVANMFKVSRTGLPIARHTLSDFLDEAAQRGIYEVQRRDITAEVLPTVKLFSSSVSDVALPAIDLAQMWLDDKLTGAGPAVIRQPVRLAANWYLGHWRHRVQRYAERLDPEAFAQHGCYIVSLLQHTSGRTPKRRAA